MNKEEKKNQLEITQVNSTKENKANEAKIEEFEFEKFEFKIEANTGGGIAAFIPRDTTIRRKRD